MIEADIRCLTIAHPWAWLIVMGLRPYERRSWSTKYRGRLWIHSASTYYPDDFEAAEEELGIFISDEDQESDLFESGAVIGSVELFDVVADPDDPENFRWLLRNAKPFTSPVFAKGKLGLWRPDARLSQQLSSYR